MKNEEQAEIPYQLREKVMKAAQWNGFEVDVRKDSTLSHVNNFMDYRKRVAQTYLETGDVSCLQLLEDSKEAIIKIMGL